MSPFYLVFVLYNIMWRADGVALVRGEVIATIEGPALPSQGADQEAATKAAGESSNEQPWLIYKRKLQQDGTKQYNKIKCFSPAIERLTVIYH